jgi:hypothetical protein
MYAVMQKDKPLIPIRELSIVILYATIHGGEVVRLPDGATLRRGLDGHDAWVKKDNRGEWVRR